MTRQRIEDSYAVRSILYFEGRHDRPSRLVCNPSLIYFGCGSGFERAQEIKGREESASAETVSLARSRSVL
jgi:hypothetical protein